MDKTLAVLQYKDEVQQRRTGVTPNNQGLPDDAMNPTATGAALITSAADSRIELIARVFGETSIKRMFRLLYRAVKRVATDAISYWDGESFATVDPTQWPDDMSLKVDIGLGTSNKQQQLGYLQMVGAGQEKLWQAQGNAEGPALKLEHLANTFRKAVETAGFSNTGQFVANDQEIEQGKMKAAQNPPPVPPEIQIKQQELQLKQQEAQQAAQASANQDQLDSARLQFDHTKLATDNQLRQQEMAQKAQELQLRREEIQAKTQEHAMTLAHDAAQSNAQRNHEMGKVQEGENTKRHAEETKAFATPAGSAGLAQFGQMIAEGMRQQGADMRAGLEKLAEEIGSEKELVRGPDGKAAGVRKRDKQ
jgi:hypothetical protein